MHEDCATHAWEGACIVHMVMVCHSTEMKCWTSKGSQTVFWLNSCQILISFYHHSWICIVLYLMSFCINCEIPQHILPIFVVPSWRYACLLFYFWTCVLCPLAGSFSRYLQSYWRSMCGKLNFGVLKLVTHALVASRFIYKSEAARGLHDSFYLWLLFAQSCHI